MILQRLEWKHMSAINCLQTLHSTVSFLVLHKIKCSAIFFNFGHKFSSHWLLWQVLKCTKDLSACIITCMHASSDSKKI